MIENRQKKIITNTLLLIGILITLFGVVIWILTSKDLPLYNELWAEIIGKISALFPTILGILIKIILSMIIKKQNIKAIDNHLIESGIKPLSEIKQSNKSAKNELKDYFHYKDYHFKVSKNKIVIIFNEKDTIDNYKELKVALGEFIEKVRQDLPTQLI